MQSELTHLREHLAEGLGCSRMAGKVLELIDVEVIGFAGFQGRSGARKSSLLEAGDDQCAEQPLGLVITVPQIDEQHFALIHYLTNIETVFLLTQHVEQAGVVCQSADLIGGAAHHAGPFPTPTVEFIGEKSITVRGHFGVCDLSQSVSAKVVVSQQLIEAAQSFSSFNQSSQGGAHDLLEAGRLRKCPGPGAHEGGDHPLSHLVGFRVWIGAF